VFSGTVKMRSQTQLSLHLHHPSRDLSTVCTALGLVPRHIWKKGDERKTPTGRQLGGTRDSSYCSVDLGDTSREPLPNRIEAALAELEPHQAILQDVSSTGGRDTFYVGWFLDEHTGDTLHWPMLERMGALRIELALNLYIPDEEFHSGGERAE
jgi:hypothetical protein